MTPPPVAEDQSAGWPDRPVERPASEVRLAGLVLLALRSVAPAAVGLTLSTLLAEELGAGEVQLYLTDYQMLTLHLIFGSALTQEPALPQPMEGSSLGEVFLTQRPVVAPTSNGELSVLVPVTVRGQRLGVLRALLPARDDATATAIGPDARVDALRTAADVLAHVVIEASTGSDVFEVTRRSSRFTVAAEMQWQLLPGRAIHTPAYTLAGLVEPAPYVQGDAFDWSADGDALTLCAVHVSGHGQSAALLSTLAVTALRNARRAEIALADQTCLANQAVYAEYDGDRHVSALLMRIDPAGRAQVVDAGSPALLRWRGQSGERLHLDAQMPLGMFDDTPYTTQDVQLEPGDRLLIATPGALDATSPQGQRFGEGGLLRQLELTRTLPPQELARKVIAALVAHQGQALASDASVLCLDWRGSSR